MRNEVIEKVSKILQEDISSQFRDKELAAVSMGKDYFYIENCNGRCKIISIYYEYSDSIDYCIYVV